MANQDKDAKRLRRADLLELLVEMGKENDALKAELAATHAELEERALKQEKAGTMAEAALALSEVFAAADAACVKFLEGVRYAYGAKESEAQKDAERIVAAAKEEARLVAALAEEHAERLERKARKKARKIVLAAKIEAESIRKEARKEACE